jgi:RNA 2',3'-cyclic 3'-phosphodiesterase
VGSGDSLRLFCALRLPDEAVEALVSWQRRELHEGKGVGVRLVPRANLHVTLAFLGARPSDELPSIVAALRSAADAARDLRFTVRSYRETRSVGMVTFDDEDGRAAVLAGALHELLEELGAYRHEARPWLPHVTVLRFRERPRLRPPLPELGPNGEDWVAPSDAAVYISRLRPGGAEYRVLGTAGLGTRSV